MLFTTAAFVLLYLPIVLGGYFLLGWRRPGLAAGWLAAASLFFYGYWMPAFTLLLLASIAVNFGIGLAIARRAPAPGMGQPASRVATLWLIAGITFNLGLLAYFKYANFLVDNFNALTGLEWHIGHIILPIGISFYSFTQIAYLVDCWRGIVKEFRIVHYGLFVTFFPHLIAGPVLHHAQMMPQFAKREVYGFQGANFWAGLVIFSIGLLKKVVLADGIAPYADAVFSGADAGFVPTLAEAWLGALAYTLQIYFDFSGYSDMAIGLSWLFNIRLPFNFNSPYKARNISEFWRRWHITLSTFLRDYLYIGLGGNRFGAGRRYANLMITMVLGGLWHGASWSFVIWGGLHGAYLMVNHCFRALTERLGWQTGLDASKPFGWLSWVVTLLAVVVAWVFFRAQTLAGAGKMLLGLTGAVHAMAGLDPALWNAGLQPGVGLAWVAVLGFVALALPNSNWLGERVRERFATARDLRVGLGAAALLTALLLVLLNTARESVSAFIYFNF